MTVNFSKFLHSGTGKYVMSIILGIGLATFFRSVCKGDRCVISYAPPFEEIDDEIYRFDDKCYKFSKSAVQCNYKNKKIYGFA